MKKKLAYLQSKAEDDDSREEARSIIGKFDKLWTREEKYWGQI